MAIRLSKSTTLGRILNQYGPLWSVWCLGAKINLPRRTMCCMWSVPLETLPEARRYPTRSYRYIMASISELVSRAGLPIFQLCVLLSWLSLLPFFFWLGVSSLWVSILCPFWDRCEPLANKNQKKASLARICQPSIWKLRDMPGQPLQRIMIWQMLTPREPNQLTIRVNAMSSRPDAIAIVVTFIKPPRVSIVRRGTNFWWGIVNIV